MSTTTNESPGHATKRIHLRIPPRYLALVGGAFSIGACLGMMRGSRMASLRFLAENAHRPPRTVRGWYLYHKTKNYRIMLGAMKSGAREALKLGGLMFGWVAIEEGLDHVGCGDVKEIGAGVGTASAFSFISRFPWRTTRKTVVLGLGVGCVMRGLRWVQESMRKTARYEDGVEAGSLAPSYTE